NLMGTARFEPNLQQGMSPQAPYHTKMRNGSLPRHVRAHILVAGWLRQLAQRGIDAVKPLGPYAIHQAQIGFFDFPLAQLPLQVTQGRTFAGNQQAARSATIEAMYQLEKRIRPGGPQRL